ncbi:hypothetical protein K7432_014486 [Basidiobolus ranarum]|uniref:Uncharacterized protein n=1 Tax=Basidiobolus ranarum TaxID=34480 RepID=A0ABR2VPG4_9FUNG
MAIQEEILVVWVTSIIGTLATVRKRTNQLVVGVYDGAGIRRHLRITLRNRLTELSINMIDVEE